MQSGRAIRLRGIHIGTLTQERTHGDGVSIPRRIGNLWSRSAGSRHHGAQQQERHHSRTH
jgi:hypothetical protein